jgi:hypothetical protein
MAQMVIKQQRQRGLETRDSRSFSGEKGPKDRGSGNGTGWRPSPSKAGRNVYTVHLGSAEGEKSL